MTSPHGDKLAVLIDADNAQASIVGELLAEVSRYGTASVKRAYGDWTTTNLKGWKDVLHKMAIQPMQQFSYTTHLPFSVLYMSYAVQDGRSIDPAPGRETAPLASLDRS